MATANVKQVEIPKLNLQRIALTLVGDSELIMHRWSDKAKKMMLDKQMTRAQPQKETRDPEAEYHESYYKYPGGGYGFPSVCFKHSAVKACTQVEGIPMTTANKGFHVNGEFVKIEGDEPHMREDLVRLNGKTADLRYRAGFLNWWCTLDITFNADVFSEEMVINLFNVAGFGCGIGEMRPEKTGKGHGRFHVADAAELGKLGLLAKEAAE